MKINTKEKTYSMLSGVIRFIHFDGKTERSKFEKTKAKAIVLKRLEEKTGIELVRQQFDRWVPPSIEGFSEPGLFIGLALVQIGEELDNKPSRGVGTPKKKEVPCKPKLKRTRSKITR